MGVKKHFLSDQYLKQKEVPKDFTPEVGEQGNPLSNIILNREKAIEDIIQYAIDNGIIIVTGSTTAPNLAIANQNANTLDIDISGPGTDATIPAATTTLAGLLTAALKIKLDGIEANANNYSHPNHSGDVVSSGDGATTIANNAVTTPKIADNAVTFAKIQDMTTQRLLGRASSGSGDPEEILIGSNLSLDPSTKTLSATTGTTLYQYDAGDGAYVFATGEGITFVKSAGTGTFTIPSGVKLISARIHGEAADLSSNNFTIVFSGHILNSSTATLFPPTIQKYDRAIAADPTTSIPYVYDIDNTPQIQIVGVNPLTMRVVNLNGISNWGLKIQS